MPYIQIHCLPLHSKEKSKMLLEQVTKSVYDVLHCPLDKISVSILEIEKSNWADAGVVSDDPEFMKKSERKRYDTE